MAMPRGTPRAIRRGRLGGRRKDGSAFRPLLERVPWNRSPRIGSRCRLMPTVDRRTAVNRS
eukprot:6209800-Pleurochrysis_carterae.AAC.1